MDIRRARGSHVSPGIYTKEVDYAAGSSFKSVNRSGSYYGGNGSGSGSGGEGGHDEQDVDNAKMPLTFEVLSGGIIWWEDQYKNHPLTIEYRKNGTEWITLESGFNVGIFVNGGDIVEVRGNLNSVYCPNPSPGVSWHSHFATDDGEYGVKFNVKGNIMSLLNDCDFSSLSILPDKATFSCLFRGCTGLQDASKLILPAKTLTTNCYNNMFSGCTNLTTPPELPATVLSYGCYSQMFSNCINLTSTPKLPSTTLVERCYTAMFYGCTSLSTAPELPATTLAPYCYYNMFKNCTSLNYVRMVATDISATNALTSWLGNVGQSGTFVKNSTMITLPSGASGIPEGWTVQNVE